MNAEDMAAWRERLHLKEKIVNRSGREFLKPWVEKQGMDMLAVFRVEGCRAHTWSMATNFAAKEFIPLTD